MLPYLTLSIISYGSRVKWSNPGKGVAPSPTSWCSRYRKGSLRVTLDYHHPTLLLLYIYILYIYIYIYIYIMTDVVYIILLGSFEVFWQVLWFLKKKKLIIVAYQTRRLIFRRRYFRVIFVSCREHGCFSKYSSWAYPNKCLVVLRAHSHFILYRQSRSFSYCEKNQHAN